MPERLRERLPRIAAFLAVFLVVVAIVATHHAAAFDAHALLSIDARRFPGAHRLAELLSRLGAPSGAGLVAAVATAYLFGRERYRDGAILASACAGSAILDVVLKGVFARPAPIVDMAQLHTTDNYSFPSGHALGATVLYGMLAALCVNARPERATTIRTLFALPVLGIGASRLVLGVHWPSDVLGGFALGATWLEFCLGFMPGIAVRVRRPAD